MNPKKLILYLLLAGSAGFAILTLIAMFGSPGSIPVLLIQLMLYSSLFVLAKRELNFDSQVGRPEKYR